MINAILSISNPFPKGVSDKLAQDFFQGDRKFSKNKSLEWQLTKWRANKLFYISIDASWFGFDHAGPSFAIEVLGLYFSISIYDHRHWDYENDTWQVYEGDLL